MCVENTSFDIQILFAVKFFLLSATKFYMLDIFSLIPVDRT